MDVRCAQCQAEYELDDTLVAERGTAVCCSRCGFRFRAYRPAGAVAAPERWTVRTLAGDTLTFLSLRELQEAIVLRRVGPQDALIRGQAPARSIASIVEFRPLFEAAKRGSETLTKARPSMPTPVGLGGPPVGGSSPSLSTPARAVGRPGPEPSGAPAPTRATPGMAGRPAGVLPATPPSASLLVAARPSGAAAGHASRPATLAGFEAPSAAIFDQPTVPNFDAAGATDTPPAALVVPRGGLRERPSMPSLIQTIPFDQANQGAAREAFEAALRGGGFEGEIVLPGGLGPGLDKNDVTQPLFAGPGGASRGQNLAAGGLGGGQNPAAGGLGGGQNLAAGGLGGGQNLAAGGPGEGQNRAAGGAGRQGGLSSTANSLRAFVASDVVTPADGSSRQWPSPPSAVAAGAGPGGHGALYEAGRAGDGAGGGAFGAQGGRRAAGAEAPWVPPRRPASPPLRWFLVAAAALALAGGLALRKGLAPVGGSSAAASAAPIEGQLDALVASGDAALAGGDYDGAIAAYARAKALSAGDARAKLGSVRAEVLRAEGAWWRSRFAPGGRRAGAGEASSAELAEAAGRVTRALGEVPASEDGGALALRVDALRVAGELAAARAIAAPLASAPGVEAPYAWAALRLAEGKPLDAEALGRLRAASGEVAPGRVGVALAYALALAGEAEAARAEAERLAASPKPVAALPELRAWLEARAAAPAAVAPAEAAAAPGPAVPAKRRRPKAPGARPAATKVGATAAKVEAAPAAAEAKGPIEAGHDADATGPASTPPGAAPAPKPAGPGGAQPSPGAAPSKPADEGDASDMP